MNATATPVMASDLLGAPVPGPKYDGSMLDFIAGVLLSSRVDTVTRTQPDEQMAAYSGWAYACISVISQDIRAAKWDVWVGDEKLDELQFPPTLMRPLGTPMGAKTLGQLIELSMLSLDLTGAAFWNQVTTAPKGGRFLGIQYIPRNWVTGPLLNPTTGVFEGWKVTSPGSAMKVYDPDSLHMSISHPHPDDIFDGASPVKAFALSYDMDLHARAYVRSVLKNDARVSGILTTEQELVGTQAKVIAEAWLEQHGEGAGTATGPAVLGKGAKYQAMSLAIAELAFTELAEQALDQITGILHVPRAKLGLSNSGGNLELTREMSNTYSENCLTPRLDKTRDAVQIHIIEPLIAQGELPQGAVFRFRSLIKADLDAEHNRSMGALKTGAIVLNDFLRETGREEIGSEGDVRFLPTNFRIVTSIEPFDPFDAIAGPSDEEEPEEPDDKEDEDAGPVCKLGAERIELIAVYFLAAQSKRESSLKGGARRMFSREQREINTAIGRAFKLAGEDEITSAEAARINNIISNVLTDTKTAWETTVKTNTFAAYKDGWALLGHDGVASEFQVSFKLTQPEAKRWAADNAAKQVKAISNTTETRLRDMVTDAVDNGDSISKLKTGISGKFDEMKAGRAEVIARQETSSAINLGKKDHTFKSSNQYGIQYNKTWLPVLGDGRTRPTHRSMAILPSITIPQDAVWIIGGYQADWAQDPTLPAEESIQCRCTVVVEVAEGV